MFLLISFFFFFFFNDTATTEIYTLSLHDALPIYHGPVQPVDRSHGLSALGRRRFRAQSIAVITCLMFVYSSDRKSTRLNSSHGYISYAVFCLKKKKKKNKNTTQIMHYEL